MKILALDLGKFNTMCCFFDSKTRKHSFLNATTDRHYLSTVFKKHKSIWLSWRLVGLQAGSMTWLAGEVGKRRIGLR
jgi:hypothetical protein